MSTQDFEKLGVFYLGKSYDLSAKKRGDDLLLYDSKDLVTHAVCVGMTGSGKTGLCLGILEEAAIDGIPAIVIDPKGDLSNLLLAFPELRPADFRPWINEDDAVKKGVTPDEFAAQQASLWAKGLAEWGEDGARIRRLKESAEFAVYTPGSSAGLPVSVLRSFDAPPTEIAEDGELLRERVSGTATSLLGLMGITADPVQSREHILLSAILADAWGKGQSLDLAGLIQRIQQPPIARLGVMELESVYPSKDRFGLAMALNNLVAAPGFASWMEGPPLDIARMLYGPAGKPRVAIFSIAHLGDAERMFFVSMLLNQVLGWVRSQSGTTSLRALVYMDEIAGYFPPTANPPSKAPLLTLMKQARAFGVGVVLATQNPVDLDYKGLSNAGTWFIGRLQTERDKQRVLDGLEGAAAGAGAGFDRGSMDKVLSQLGSRVFLMNNVHENRPVIFESRWCLSYLRGPLTRQQIKSLMDPVRKPALDAAEAVPPPPASPVSGGPAAGRAGASTANPAVGQSRPVLAPDVPQYFIPTRLTPAGASIEYRPMLLGVAKVYFSDAKAGISVEEPVSMLAPIETGPVAVDWDKAEPTDLTEADVEREPVGGLSFADLPPDAGKSKSYEAWTKLLAEALFRGHTLDLMSSREYGMVSKPGETEPDFRLRLAQTSRERRDALADKMRQKYGPKLSALQERIRKAEQAVDVQKQQARGAKWGAAVSFGTALLGAFMGRKLVSASNVSKAGTAMRGVGKTFKESSDVSRAEDNVDSLQRQYADLEAQFKTEVDNAGGLPDPLTCSLDRASLKPKKTNITVRAVILAWAPCCVDQSGKSTPAW